MSMIDDLGKIKDELDAARPKSHVDYVYKDKWYLLSTRCPVSTEEGVRVLYKDKLYLIANQAMIDKVTASFYEEIQVGGGNLVTTVPGPLWLPVIKNEGLVREILLYIDSQPDSGLVLSNEAMEWVRRSNFYE